VVKRAQRTKSKKAWAGRVAIDIWGTPPAIRLDHGDGGFSLLSNAETISDHADALRKLGPIVRLYANLSDDEIESSGLLDQFMSCWAELQSRRPAKRENAVEEMHFGLKNPPAPPARRTPY
jgi:hypothetical protein